MPRPLLMYIYNMHACYPAHKPQPVIADDASDRRGNGSTVYSIHGVMLPYCIWAISIISERL